eukprot:763237-Hanusia_phi.AAC.2
MKRLGAWSQGWPEALGCYCPAALDRLSDCFVVKKLKPTRITCPCHDLIVNHSPDEPASTVPPVLRYQYRACLCRVRPGGHGQCPGVTRRSHRPPGRQWPRGWPGTHRAVRSLRRRGRRGRGAAERPEC